MNDISPEARPPHAPIIRQAFDSRFDHPELTAEERKLFQFEYVIEDLESDTPYLSNYNPQESLLIGILNADSIIYTNKTAHHRVLRDAEGVDTEMNKSHFQIDYMPSGIDISLNGTREQVLEMVKFLIKSGFSLDLPIKSSVWKDGKWNNGGTTRYPGTLGKPNI